MPFFDRLAVEKRMVMLDDCGHMPGEDPGLAQLARALRDFQQFVARITEGGRC
jgi:hypothetical protein